MKMIKLLVPVMALFFASCSPQVEGAFPEETVKAFSEAGLTLLGQKTDPRDFSLPLASFAMLPEGLAKNMSLAGLQGKVVFLNFWATWCGPCRVEMPSMEALYQKYKDRGFEILAVNSGERPQEVIAFMIENNFTFLTVLDTNGAVSRSYGIQAIPTSYLIDRDGKIILRMVGSIDWNTPQIHAALELLLSAAVPE